MDNTWESADHVCTPALTQNYHQKNPLSSTEQDKRGQKKRKVSIHSLKSFLQQHHHSPLKITCLPPPPTFSLVENSPNRPSPLLTTPSNPLPIHLPPKLLPPPPNIQATVHPLHLPSTQSLKRAKLSHASTTTATPFPPELTQCPPRTPRV